MNRQELRTLRILEAIETDPLPSQREMARRLNVSLGLVNSFIKRLAHKGYFKITTVPKNRLRYILTPQGAAEKTRLTYLYIQHSLEFYKSARNKLRDLFQRLTSENVRHIVFCGADDLTEIAYLSLQETPIRLTAVVDLCGDDRRYIWGRVRPLTEIRKLRFDRVLVTAVEQRDKLIEQLAQQGVSEEIVVMPE
ncbi:MAG: winged helix-turn-helix transcriptional regulator [Desulfobacteraceae bacterium]|jgi:DNA-binding MarR family transcriptional regulator|nr:winged helix-turn-helix transcriptional regulator [Desulfobacteraceae bacterium]